jgi:hypothetical protein
LQVSLYQFFVAQAKKAGSSVLVFLLIDRTRGRVFGELTEP